MIEKRYEFELPIRNPKELRLLIETAFGVTVPDVQVCPDHSTPWRALCDAYFARSPVTVWKASRGFGGKSYLLSLLSMVEALTLGCDVNILGGSGEQSKRVLEAMKDLWARPHAPIGMLTADVKFETRLTNGAKVLALMASQASVRGPHPARLRCDEVDEMDMAIMDAALGQPMTQRGVAPQTVLSSTHQYAAGTMTEVIRRSRDQGWPYHEWCFRESLEPHGWLAQTEVDSKKLTVPASMWRTEYEGQEPSPEGRAIDDAAVKAAFRRELGDAGGDAHSARIEVEAPASGGTYAHGFDWARKVDHTDGVTLRSNVSPMRVVVYRRMRRMPWPVMAAELDDRMKRYGGKACHDGTGIGDVVASQLTERAEAVMMVGRARQDLISDYINGMERGEVEWPWVQCAYDDHLYATVDDLYGAGHLPDSIAAGALAYRAAKKQPFLDIAPEEVQGRREHVRYQEQEWWDDDDDGFETSRRSRNKPGW